MLNREPITEQAATFLAEAVIHGELADGDRIPEQTWAARLGVSRGSLREALLILERRHLVRIEPRRGARVVAMDADWASDIADAWFLLLRAVVAAVLDRRPANVERRLDAAVTRMGALLDVGDLEGFQETGMTLAVEVSRASGNRVYAAMMRNLLPAVRRCFRTTLDAVPGEGEGALAFLADLRTAFRLGDADAADTVVRRFAAAEKSRLIRALA